MTEANFILCVSLNETCPITDISFSLNNSFVDYEEFRNVSNNFKIYYIRKSYSSVGIS